jgi:protein-disulfide isomerase
MESERSEDIVDELIREDRIEEVRKRDEMFDGTREKSYTQKMRENPWILSTIILGIILILTFVSTSGNGSDLGINSGKVSKDIVSENVMSILALTAPSAVTLSSIEEESGLYKINVNFEGDVAPIYATQDGKYMITGVIPIDDVGDITGGIGNVGSGGIVDVSEDDDAFKGSQDAPVTIIEFSDFECPFCGRFYEQTLPLIEEEYINTGKVKLVYRDFPLSNIHPNAQKAAEAAECVKDDGGDDAFWKMHDKIYENQNSLTISNLKSWAKEIGYDINTCLDSGAKASEVQKDLADGTVAGVTGTPAFFINGKLLEGAQPYTAFKLVIDEELGKI